MEKTEAGDLEKHAFLHHNPTPAIQYSNGAKRGASDSKSACCGKKCCCCTISWKCCGITSAVILVIIGAIIGGGFLYLHILKSRLTGTASSENAAEWESFLTKTDSSGSEGNNGDLITGDYVLVSYDENYPELLKAYGIPSFIVPFILGSSETIHLTRNGDRFKMVTETENYPKKEVNFKIGQLFEKEWGQKKKGIMHSNCTLPEPNKLFCSFEERKKGWMLTEEISFSKGGFINNCHFLTRNVKTKRFYQRQGISLNDFGLDSKTSNLTLIVPPSEEEDYPFAKNDDEDDFGDFESIDSDFD